MFCVCVSKAGWQGRSMRPRASFMRERDQCVCAVLSAAHADCPGSLHRCGCGACAAAATTDCRTCAHSEGVGEGAGEQVSPGCMHATRLGAPSPASRPGSTRWRRRLDEHALRGHAHLGHLLLPVDGAAAPADVHEVGLIGLALMAPEPRKRACAQQGGGKSGGSVSEGVDGSRRRRQKFCLPCRRARDCGAPPTHPEWRRWRSRSGAWRARSSYCVGGCRKSAAERREGGGGGLRACASVCRSSEECG